MTQETRVCGYCGEPSPICFGGFRSSACSFRFEELRRAAEHVVEVRQLGYQQSEDSFRHLEKLVLAVRHEQWRLHPTRLALLGQAAATAKILLEQLAHIGNGLEYDGLDEMSALENVAGLLGRSPAYEMLCAALTPDSKCSVCGAGYGEAPDQGCGTYEHPAYHPPEIRVQAGKVDEAAIERIKTAKARAALEPLRIEPHPFCASEHCEHCTENYYPNGSPRYSRGGNPIAQGPRPAQGAEQPLDLQTRFDALAGYVRSFGGDVDAIIENRLGHVVR